MRTVAALALVCWAGWQVAQPSLDLAAVLADPAPSAAARRLVVGYDDPDLVRTLARRGLVGGVFLTRRNVSGRTEQAIADEIASFQEAAHAGGIPPLVVAADQEGGAVSHLSPPLPAVPALSALSEMPAEAREAAAQDLGRSAGAALRHLGITMDLAPVVDLTPADPPSRFDLHTRIATRSISADPGVVADIAAGFARGLLEEGITPVAKHFPGLGAIRTDTHLFAAANDRPLALLSDTDWVPFRAMADVPGAAVMVSHAALSAVDPGVPASQSRHVIQDVLRGDLAFKGQVITDDMTMGPIVHAGFYRGIADALHAGADLVLVSWDIGKVPTAIRCALASSVQDIAGRD